MIWILGILDILTAVIIAVQKFYAFKLALVFVAYLLAKSILFIKDFSSIVDFIAAIFFILAIFGHFYMVTWIFVLWIFQKGIFSLFG